MEIILKSVNSILETLATCYYEDVGEGFTTTMGTIQLYVL